jgi:predicted unusual protein kinase regulating ubiquinone biosynthesis (AarF/ABC1/UbiB family)
MSDRERTLREEIQRRLLAAKSKLPTSSAGRFGRMALTALRGGGLIRRRGQADSEDAPLDLDALSAMVASIGQLKGVAMKVGQIMSYIDVALPDDLRAALAVLQTQSPPMPFERVVEIVNSDLGPHAAELLAKMAPTPAAAASIGQVHRAELPGGQIVAVKVRYPDIEKAIASDFRPAAIGTKIGALFYPGAKIDEMVKEARERFLQECDYLHEAESQRRFAQIYDGHPTIMVPAVHPDFCGPRVLTSSWMDGLDFEAYLSTNPSSAERDRLGEALFEFYVGTLFRQGLYNCDPHPGNYLFLPDGRIAMLDYGCVREFTAEFVAKLASLTHAVHSDKVEDLHRVFVDLEMVREGRRYDFDTARTLVRSFYGPMLRDEVQAIEVGEGMTFKGMVKSKRELMKLRLPGEFLFLLRIRFGLMSVLARLGTRANWYRLERQYLEAVKIPC